MIATAPKQRRISKKLENEKHVFGCTQQLELLGSTLCIIYIICNSNTRYSPELFQLFLFFLFFLLNLLLFFFLHLFLLFQSLFLLLFLKKQGKMSIKVAQGSASPIFSTICLKQLEGPVLELQWHFFFFQSLSTFIAANLQSL